MLEVAGLSRLDMVKIRINRPLLTEILRRLCRMSGQKRSKSTKKQVAAMILPLSRLDCHQQPVWLGCVPQGELAWSFTI